jgi:hypothetical protein
VKLPVFLRRPAAPKPERKEPEPVDLRELRVRSRIALAGAERVVSEVAEVERMIAEQGR